MEMKLIKDRNQCPTCGKYFNSTFAFDTHRTGSYQPNQRRCLTEEEMLEKGMEKNFYGFWVSKRMAIAER